MSMGLLLPFRAELYSLHSKARGRAADASMLASMLLHCRDRVGINIKKGNCESVQHVLLG